MKRILAVLSAVLPAGAVLSAVLLAAGCLNDSKGPSFQTVQVKRGNMVSTISATGTLEPASTVDIGAQVVGIIQSFGADVSGKPVDYNSVVKKGMVLAQIDPSVYQAAVASATAQLEQAHANVESANANLLQMNAKLDEASADWSRAQKIGTASGALAETTYDQYKATYETATANVAAAKAGILVANATVDADKAVLDLANRNLGYCTITSPIDGTIISRRVDIGQTVVSSLSAPSLFLIAQDLKQMVIWVAVNEADIGNIYVGQPVKFTVDAHPGMVFDGTTARARLNATMTQNVVTYTVEVDTNNDKLVLIPYLTANVMFETGHSENVLMVPNAALRWRPAAAEKEPVPAQVSASSETPAEGSATAAASPAGGPPAAAQKGLHANSGGDEPPQKHGVLWVPDGAHARPIYVTTGLDDGTETEVSGEGLSAGMDVITGEIAPGAAQAPASTGTTNPFVPQMPARGRRGR